MARRTGCSRPYRPPQAAAPTAAATRRTPSSTSLPGGSGDVVAGTRSDHHRGADRQGSLPHHGFGDDGVNRAQKISDNGHIYWTGYVVPTAGTPNFEVFHYDSKSIHQITNNDFLDDHLKVSSKGDAIWIGEGDWDLYLYDRHRLHQLTEGPSFDYYHSINSKGHVSWVSDIGADSSEIFIFQKGRGVRQVTSNNFEDYKPSINKKGQLAWMGKAGTNDTWETFFFDGNRMQRLTDNDTFDMNPIINNHGIIVWTHHTGPYLQSGELHAFDGSEKWPVTENNPEDIFDVTNLITSTGDIVYSRYRAEGSPGAQDFFVTIYLAVKN